MSYDFILGTTNLDWSRSSTAGDDVSLPQKSNLDLDVESYKKKAGEKSATGTKIRAGASLYAQQQDNIKKVRAMEALRPPRKTPSTMLVKSLDDAQPMTKNSPVRKSSRSLDECPYRSDEARAEGEDSPSCGDDLPHSEYRALVMRKAIQDAGGGQPSTRHLFAAKKAVDNALGSSGVAIYIPSTISEPKDQDIIDKLILRSGNNSGWPVYISKDRYADYQSRSKKDSRAAEIVAILDRYAGEGRLKISDEKKADIVRYPIGG